MQIFLRKNFSFKKIRKIVFFEKIAEISPHLFDIQCFTSTTLDLIQTVKDCKRTSKFYKKREKSTKKGSFLPT